MVFLVLFSFIIFLVAMLLFFVSDFLMLKSGETSEKLSPYECGFDPIGLGRLPFSNQFFSIGVIFLVFDVEICLLMPGVINISLTMISAWFMLFYLFIFILIVGTVHEMNQGALDWNN